MVSPGVAAWIASCRLEKSQSACSPTVYIARVACGAAAGSSGDRAWLAGTMKSAASSSQLLQRQAERTDWCISDSMVVVYASRLCDAKEQQPEAVPFPDI